MVDSFQNRPDNESGRRAARSRGEARGRGGRDEGARSREAFGANRAKWTHRVFERHGASRLKGTTVHVRNREQTDLKGSVYFRNSEQTLERD